jgi:hypothetical protein
MTWGSTPALIRSRASVAHWHPELPQHVVNLPDDSTVLVKSRMCDLSPFDETLFLDADTTVLGRLDYGFERAGLYGITLTISANPWQRRYYNMECPPDAVEYSSGVVFFTKNRDGAVFRRWKMQGLDSRCKYANDAGEVLEQAHNAGARDRRGQPLRPPAELELRPALAEAVLRPAENLARTRGHPEVSD